MPRTRSLLLAAACLPLLACGTSRSGLSARDAGLLCESRQLSGNQIEVFRIDYDGANFLNLTNHPADDRQPAYSSGGGLIAFASDRTGDWEIFAMDSADGGNQARLTQRPLWDDVDPAWSPDGTRIAFESVRTDNSDAEIMIVNADGTGPVNLTNTPQDHEIDPSWSQDGTKIAFTRFTNNAHLDVYVVDVGGGTPRQVTTVLTDERSPAWFAR